MSAATGYRVWKSILLLAALGIPFSGALGARLTNWMTIENEQFGYSIAYPGNIFTVEEGRLLDGGHVLVSRDGRARLLIGAFPNADETSLEEYRAFLLENNYAGGAIDYAPTRKKWFVLSGTRDGTIFYERVSFTCGGRLINSWAMLYPEAERRFYARVVEAVARTYSGRGPRGLVRPRFVMTKK